MCQISERENVSLVKVDTKKGGKMGLQVNVDQVFDFGKKNENWTERVYCSQSFKYSAVNEYDCID